MLRQFAKLLRVLNSETEPIKISLGLCFGMVVGFTQIGSVHNLVILFLVLFIRVNLSSFIIGTITFKAFSLLLSALFHKIGLWLLTANLFNEFATQLYNNTFWKFDKFYNTVKAGGIVVSVVAFIPLLILFNYLIIKYRTNILSYVRKTKIMKALRSSDLYHYYKKFSSIKEVL